MKISRYYIIIVIFNYTSNAYQVTNTFSLKLLKKNNSFILVHIRLLYSLYRNSWNPTKNSSRAIRRLRNSLAPPPVYTSHKAKIRINFTPKTEPTK